MEESAERDRLASILIVDDEESIRRTLSGVVEDEGYFAQSAGDGQTALRMIRDSRPALVLLDIWMPGMDGIETLKEIKEIYPDLPVIMISGHATIATAMSAARLGAADFIEKPLDLNATLACVRKAIGRRGERAEKSAAQDVRQEDEPQISSSIFDLSRLNRAAFASQGMAGRRVVQKTIARSAVLYGQGLHSGKKSGLILEPLPSGSGIHFVGVSESSIVPAHVEFVQSTGWATTVRLGQTQVATIEHLMSALHAYGICNLLIKCNGEVPVLDGSAQEFCALFDETGLEEQEGDWFEIRIDREIQLGDGRKFIRIEPSETFIVDYTLDYPQPVGRQQVVFAFDGPQSYKELVAPARTFGFLKDIGALQKQGLALGGRLDNFVLIGDKGPINVDLRFPDEMVRHKILDAIGDLYLLGRPIRGKVTAAMSGHSDNFALLKALFREICAESPDKPAGSANAL